MTTTLPCASPSVSSLSPLRTSTPQAPLRVAQPPTVYARHSASPSSSSTTSTPPTNGTRFPPQNGSSASSSSASSMKPIKPQIIGAGSGNAAAAVTAALTAASRPELSSKTYNELVDLARRQQHQIDANRAELTERQRLVAASMQMSHAGVDMTDQIRQLRADIARDEHELTHLSNTQKQVRSITTQNDQRRNELRHLQDAYVQDEQHLRHAVDKVDSLKKQLEQLYRRRASAASAAIAQQRHLNAVSNGTSMPSVPVSATTPLNGLTGRPQANVVPFQVQRPAVLTPSELTKAKGSGDSKMSFDQLDHAPAAGKNVSPSPMSIHKGVPLRSKRPDKPPPPPKRSPNTMATFGSPNGSKDSSVRLLNNGVEVTAPHPPLPPYSNYYANLDQSQAALKRGRADQLSLRNDSMKALKRRSWLQQSDAPEADIFRVVLEESKKGRTHISFADLHAEKPPMAKSVNVDGVTVNFRQKVAPPLPEHREVRQIQKPRVIEEPEAVPIRPVPVVDVGDLSPNVAGPTVSPVDIIGVSVSPPATGSASSGYSESSAITDPSETELEGISEVISASPKVVLEAVTAVDHHHHEESHTPESEDALKRELEQVVISEEASPDVSLPDESLTLEDDETTEEEKSAYEDADGEISPAEVTSPIGYAPTTIHVSGTDAENCIEEIDTTACSSGSSTDGDISSASESMQAPIVFDDDEEVDVAPRKPIKGILRPPGKPKHNKRIVFDPFVLFLDGALEGQLDTVKENAAKIEDVSRPNDEGITALHNAICACHYEIVQFLVDAGANVNAMDSDGWSPLHCAASCNNISMLKLLIEHGASIYATTLSDAETPIAKCEEKEAGYEQCTNYLEMCDRWAGIINDGIVYAAYDFEAEEPDDLGFVEGEPLRVLCRETDMDSKLWWRCESTVTGRTGLAPSNFLGLYPTLKFAKKLGFRRFDVPAHPPSGTRPLLNNNHAKTSSPGNESVDSAFEKSLEISANA
uniref:SH3 domain-containing protein n=1 Tax=Panagrellus redivivus TaxID=6233 RepID=A0A7E5A0L1_PANRE